VVCQGTIRQAVSTKRQRFSLFVHLQGCALDCCEEILVPQSADSRIRNWKCIIFYLLDKDMCAGSLWIMPVRCLFFPAILFFSMICFCHPLPFHCCVSGVQSLMDCELRLPYAFVPIPGS
jgi:hypothetical protein